MRLIDANKLGEVKFHSLPYTHITPSDVEAESYKRGWNDAIDSIIDNAPTIEPEIIRCKDCFCGHGEVWLSGNGEVDAYGYCGRTNLRVLPYDYYSWAERKTNGSD